MLILTFWIVGARPIAVLFLFLFSLYLMWRRAVFRFNIRSKLNIPGSFSEDAIVHTCCSFCAVCQESRESKAVQLRVLDFCFGDELQLQQEVHDRALGRSGASVVPTEDILPDNGNFFTHIQAVSKTSKVILGLSAFVCLVSFTLLIMTGRGENILILLLVFVQPIAILYFVYWVPRRQFALLDFVIKSFAVGFW